MRKGYTQVYTGSGKGKTTAAFGCALRAAGCGLRVCVIQFMKNKPSGELRGLSALPQVTIKQFGAGPVVRKESLSEDDYKCAREGLSCAGEALCGKEYGLVVLDEINIAVHMGLLKKEDLLELIKNRPAETELIITGRYADPAVIEVADLVTEMTQVKHYYDKGVEAREGVEY